jgi:hypothetical protein
MADDHNTTPLDDWLTFSQAELAELRRRAAATASVAQAHPPVAVEDVGGRSTPWSESNEERPAPPSIAKLDTAFQHAESLSPIDRLKLMARLWTMLPSPHRATLIRIQLEDIQTHTAAAMPTVRGETAGGTLHRFLFDRANTSGLYSAPRRFDLATIFVATAAYSLLLGGLTALDAGPLIKIIACGLVTVVAVGQALFHDTANPRGVSVVVGITAYTLFSIILWSLNWRDIPFSLFFMIVINGLMGGAVFGYIAGVLVGGIFLVADMLRGKFLAAQPDAETQPAANDRDVLANQAAPHGERRVSTE